MRPPPLILAIDRDQLRPIGKIGTAGHLNVFSVAKQFFHAVKSRRQSGADFGVDDREGIARNNKSSRLRCPVSGCTEQNITNTTHQFCVAGKPAEQHTLTDGQSLEVIYQW